MPKKIKGIKDLVHDPNNANKGNDRGRKAVDDSIKKYGAGRSIVVDQNGVVIGGNKTLEAARTAGIDVEVVKTKGDRLIVVQRDDLDLLKDEKARKLAYADNRAGELGLNWDLDQIKTDIDLGMNLDDIFTLDELGDMGVDLPSVEPEEAPEAQMDAAEELQAKWKVQSGDIWQIGEHRLMCGDSESKTDYGIVTMNSTPNLMVTDPPYGVNLDQTWRDKALGSKKMGDGNKNIVQNDNRASWKSVWSVFDGNIAYIWHASAFCDVVMNDLRQSGFQICQQLIWNKSILIMGRSDYHFKHEPCWYAVRKNKKHDWIGDRKQTTVIDAASPNHIMSGSTESKTEHPTQKPEACMSIPISNHSGDVYDPFLGSGTTMVAAERLGRKCYGMEIEPKYCAVILERMQQMGLEPELVENGYSKKDTDEA